ncbi:MFS transporter [Novosphingopyxis sp.]|uniref:MFS transporter n=1 Tax=Novosphingopyxis sp. TaxID=2709690 RepID=UPI003B5C2B1A
MIAPPGSLPRRKKTLFDKIAYGFGSIAYGVKDNGFQVLLLLYYNQALGLSASLVGFAVMIALVCDAISDPLVGRMSDNLRSRWGRRHPFMYAAALPVAISYYFLWNPPAGLEGDGLFYYLLILMICIRTFITFYEIPSSALVVDLTEDYDERTSFLSFRYFFGWIGGLTMAVAAFSVFLRPSPEYPDGPLNLEGYSNYGLTASLIMLVAIVVSSIGTHRHIPTFRPTPPKQPFDLARSAREIFATLTFKPFMIMLGATFFAYAASGVAGSILTYFRIYFWELTGDQISILLFGNFASVVIALFLAPRVAAHMGKKPAAIMFAVLTIILSPLAYAGRLFDVMPANGDPALVVILFITSFLNTILVMSSGVVGSSMLADVVEDFASRTRKFSAGLFFSANGFVLKALSGVGVFGAGIILDFVSFPEGAKVGAVAPDVLTNMALTEIPVLASLQIVSLLFVFAYPISRSRHEQNLRKIHVEDEVREAAAEIQSAEGEAGRALQGRTTV